MSNSSLADKAEYIADSIEELYFTKRVNLQGGMHEEHSKVGTLSLVILMLVFWGEFYYTVYLVSMGGLKYGIIGAITLTFDINNVFVAVLFESVFFLMIFVVTFINLVYFIYHKTRGGNKIVK